MSAYKKLDKIVGEYVQIDTHSDIPICITIYSTLPSLSKLFSFKYTPQVFQKNADYLQNVFSSILDVTPENIFLQYSAGHYSHPFIKNIIQIRRSPNNYYRGPHPLNCQCTSTQRVPLPLFCMTFSYKCVSEKKYTICTTDNWGDDRPSSPLTMR